LWAAGERRTAALAAALAAGDLPAGEQGVEVKRFKDRMRRRIARLATGGVGSFDEKSNG
jgi:hypothetical protein